MDYFKGINESERYNNEFLNEIRKQTELLEQIAQLLQPKGEIKNVIHSTEGIPVNSLSKGQQGQRRSNSTRGSGKR